MLCVLADGGTYRREDSANRLQQREKDLVCFFFGVFLWFVEVSVDA